MTDGCAPTKTHETKKKKKASRPILLKCAKSAPFCLETLLYFGSLCSSAIRSGDNAEAKGQAPKNANSAAHEKMFKKRSCVKRHTFKREISFSLGP